MRNKPLLHPVVAALERQEAINRYLLKQINVLRNDIGYAPLSFEYVSRVIDGDGDNLPSVSTERCDDNVIQTYVSQASSQPKPQQALAQSMQTLETEGMQEVNNSEDLKGIKRYAETLDVVEGGLELGCDDYYLTEEENEYVFEVKGNTADFYLNPDKADALLRSSQRSSWAKVAKIESGSIPELESNQKYEIKIQNPGTARLIDEYWVIETPVSIIITVK